jgi:hypothetical protein
MPRLSVALVRLAIVTLACPLACGRPNAAPDAQGGVPQADAWSVPVLSPHAAALGRDPEAMDEGLRQALHEFRDKFQCNSISGCRSEAVIVGYGWAARPYLEQLFQLAPAQASYRSRAIRALAQLRDPATQPLFLRLIQDRDPDVRAYAIWGLGLLDARGLRDRLVRVAHEEASAWLAPARFSALWALARWGDEDAAVEYVQLVKTLSEQQMAGPALTWAAELCARDDAPDCRQVLPLLARHPGFTTRRQAARTMTAHPVHGYEAALVDLAGDSVRSIADAAEDALRRLTGESLKGAEAWRTWCQQTRCDRSPNDHKPLELPGNPTPQ